MSAVEVVDWLARQAQGDAIGWGWAVCSLVQCLREYPLGAVELGATGACDAAMRWSMTAVHCDVWLCVCVVVSLLCGCRSHESDSAERDRSAMVKAK